MEALLLSAHVLAGIVFIGPAAVAASLFPRYVPLSDPRPESPRDTERSARVAQALHRITRVYGVLGIAVPVIGIGLSFVQGRFGEVWITIAMVVTALAGALLAFRVVPAQAAALALPPSRARLRMMLGVLAGVFNLLWVAVVILMVWRPGSDYVS